MNAQEIVSQIIDHISQCGGQHREWYVGIAEDPNSRLFNDHGVVREIDKWIFRICDNSEMARAIEKFLLENYEFSGDTGGGSYLTKYIYAYKIASHTQE